MIPNYLNFGEDQIPVTAIKTDTRIIEYIIKDDLSLELRIPFGTGQAMASSFLKMHASDIYMEYSKKKNRNHQALPNMINLKNGHLIYSNGQLLPYMGKMNTKLTIKYVVPGADTKVFATRHADGSRVLTIQTDNPDQGFIRYCVIRYYKKCAEDIIRSMVYDFGEKMGLKFNNVSIASSIRPPVLSLSRLVYRDTDYKEQKTLWGSCNRKSNLKFDWKLLMLPLEIIEYIIVRELTHLKKPSRQETFRAEMEKVLPEYKECRAWLEKHGNEYEIF